MSSCSASLRSEERRVGKECRSVWVLDDSSRRRHTRWPRDWSSDVCSSDLHLGKGLGLKFLQHVERTRLVAVLVPVNSPDPQAIYELLLREAASYSPELAAKPHVVVLSKLEIGRASCRERV